MSEKSATWEASWAQEKKNGVVRKEEEAVFNGMEIK